MSKSASILCNAPGGQGSQLSFAAFPIKDPDSLKLFTVSPNTLDLDATRPDSQKKPWEFDIKVKNVSSDEFSLKLVAPLTEFAEIDMPGGGIDPGKEKTIKVKLDRAVADTLYTKSFTIEASDTAHTRFTIPIKKAMRWGPAPTSSR